MFRKRLLDMEDDITPLPESLTFDGIEIGTLESLSNRIESKHPDLFSYFKERYSTRHTTILITKTQVILIHSEDF